MTIEPATIISWASAAVVLGGGIYGVLTRAAKTELVTLAKSAEIDRQLDRNRIAALEAKIGETESELIKVKESDRKCREDRDRERDANSRKDKQIMALMIELNDGKTKMIDLMTKLTDALWELAQLRKTKTGHEG